MNRLMIMTSMMSIGLILLEFAGILFDDLPDADALSVDAIVDDAVAHVEHLAMVVFLADGALDLLHLLIAEGNADDIVGSTTPADAGSPN